MHTVVTLLISLVISAGSAERDSINFVKWGFPVRHGAKVFAVYFTSSGRDSVQLSGEHPWWDVVCRYGVKPSTGKRPKVVLTSQHTQNRKKK